MSARSRIDLPLLLLGVLLLGLYLPKLALAEHPLYTEWLTERWLLAVGCTVKLMALWSGTIVTFRVARSFASGDGMRLGWTLAAIWLGSWALAQSVLGVYQIGLGRSAPYPSAGDLFFIVGYPAMIAAFVVFARSVTATGLVGTLRAQLTFAGVAALPGVALLVVVLRPVVGASTDPLEQLLNVAYPTLDVVALVPALILARLGARLAGGALFFVWALWSAGILFLIAGDLLYAWFSTLEFSALDPLIDVAYLAGYVLIARAVFQQHRISVSPRLPAPGG